ncbi:hypothetical protein [Allokutzneria oryzae]|uniref:PspA domain-containing protein n=1 Tax=Allokutzneria oryzae TaxID=1378989 RepID=A0ABV6A5R7_9PSEU
MTEPKPHDPAPIEGEVVASTVEPPAPVTPQFDYDDGGVPTLDYVRDRIESRFTTSIGATELATDATSVDQQMADRDQAGRDRLEQIRRSMRGE